MSCWLSGVAPRSGRQRPLRWISRRTWACIRRTFSGDGEAVAVPVHAARAADRLHEAAGLGQAARRPAPAAAPRTPAACCRQARHSPGSTTSSPARCRRPPPPAAPPPRPDPGAASPPRTAPVPATANRACRARGASGTARMSVRRARSSSRKPAPGGSSANAAMTSSASGSLRRSSDEPRRSRADRSREGPGDARLRGRLKPGGKVQGPGRGCAHDHRMSAEPHPCHVSESTTPSGPAARYVTKRRPR